MHTYMEHTHMCTTAHAEHVGVAAGWMLRHCLSFLCHSILLPFTAAGWMLRHCLSLLCHSLLLPFIAVHAGAAGNQRDHNVGRSDRVDHLFSAAVIDERCSGEAGWWPIFWMNHYNCFDAFGCPGVFTRVLEGLPIVVHPAKTDCPPK